MEFLAVVVGLVLLSWPQFFAAIQRDSWFGSWQSLLTQSNALNKYPIAALVLAVGIPVVVVNGLLVLLERSDSGLLYFFISLLTLLYAFGRGDSRTQVDGLVEDLTRNDLQAAFHDLAAFSIDVSEGASVDLNEFYKELKTRLAYSYFERYVVVLFLFILAGAPLALLYRLSILYRKNTQTLDVMSPVGQRWIAFVEWLPLRVLGLTMAIVGHFDACFRCWRECLWSMRDTQQTLLALVNAAIDSSTGQNAQETVSDERPGVVASQLTRNIEKLFFNAIVCWLVVISLAIIFA
jgi:AmpE protein